LSERVEIRFEGLAATRQSGARVSWWLSWRPSVPLLLAAPLLLFMLAFYVPAGFYIDTALWRKRERARIREREQERETSRKNYHLIERSVGVFQRSLRLPAPVDANQVQARFNNGVLTVTIPKDGVKDRSRRVQIRSGSGTEETSESQKGSPAAADDADHMNILAPLRSNAFVVGPELRKLTKRSVLTTVVRTVENHLRMVMINRAIECPGCF